MPDAVIREPLRTPVGGFGGSLRDLPAHELAATVIRLQAVIQAAMQVEAGAAQMTQVPACTREWRFTPTDFDRLDVPGSGTPLGHPVGATGGRTLATLAREMVRRDARYGVETMCIGGGQGLAAVFERVA